jgi:hypothetical protein
MGIDVSLRLFLGLGRIKWLASRAAAWELRHHCNIGNMVLETQDSAREINFTQNYPQLDHAVKQFH